MTDVKGRGYGKGKGPDSVGCMWAAGSRGDGVYGDVRRFPTGLMI